VEHEREYDPRDGELDDDHSALSQFDAQLSLLGHRLLHAKMLAAEACGEADDIRIVQNTLRTHDVVTVQKSDEPDSTLETDPSEQNCLLSAPPIPAPKALRRPFGVVQKPD